MVYSKPHFTQSVKSHELFPLYDCHQATNDRSALFRLATFGVDI